jgi:HAD superfamily hydrolase (TIGR01509 family)
MIHAVLFDLDGVLVDACDWHYKALNESLIHFNFNPISLHDHLSIFNGLPTHVKLDMLNIPSNFCKKINDFKQKITLDIIKNNAKIMQEKIELHEWLKKNNIKIGCVTNSIKKTADEMLQMTGQLQYMDIVITNEDVIRNKPSPDCYNLAIQTLKVNPFGVLCVEDSEKGILAAKNSIAKHILIVKNTKEVNLINIQNKLKDIK